MNDQVIFEYTDGRRGETGAEGFKENHEPYGAKIVAYTGADGREYPATDEGRADARKASDARQSALVAETMARQAAEKPTALPITNVSMRPKEAAKAPPKETKP